MRITQCATMVNSLEHSAAPSSQTAAFPDPEGQQCSSLSYRYGCCISMGTLWQSTIGLPRSYAESLFLGLAHVASTACKTDASVLETEPV